MCVEGEGRRERSENGWNKRVGRLAENRGWSPLALDDGSDVNKQVMPAECITSKLRAAPRAEPLKRLSICSRNVREPSALESERAALYDRRLAAPGVRYQVHYGHAERRPAHRPYDRLLAYYPCDSSSNLIEKPGRHFQIQSTVGGERRRGLLSRE